MKISVDSAKHGKAKVAFSISNLMILLYFAFGSLRNPKKHDKAKVAFYDGNLMILLLNVLKISIFQDTKSKVLHRRSSPFYRFRCDVGAQAHCLAKGVLVPRWTKLR